MEGLKPGRIVYFVFDEPAELTVNGGYSDANSSAGIDLMMSKSGAQIHVGNRVRTGDICPAMVTAVFGEPGICNLKVMLGGSDTYWATSVEFREDHRPNSWHWMFEGQRTRYQPDRTEVTATP